VLANLLDTMKALGFDHESGTLRHAHDRLEAIEDLGLGALLDVPREKLLELGVLGNGRWESFLDVAMPFFVEACRQQHAQAAFTLEDQKYFGWLTLRRDIAEGRRPEGDAAITHILVDEFQDINPLDLALILTIADLNGSRLTIVGDDDQAIFEWRGAAPDFILYPEQHLRRTFSTHILTRNYRCPRNIVEKSARLIAHNKRRESKEMIPVSTVDAQIDRLHGETFLHTTQRITEEIAAFVKAGVPGARMALLSRKRAQLIPYQILLARDEIAFCAAEDLHVFLSDTFERLLRALRIRHTATQMPALAKIGFRLPTVVDDIMGLCDSVQRFPLRRAEADAIASHLRMAQPATYDAAIEALETYVGPIRGKQDDGRTVKDFALRLRKFLHAPDVGRRSRRCRRFMAASDRITAVARKIYFSPIRHFSISRFSPNPMAMNSSVSSTISTRPRLRSSGFRAWTAMTERRGQNGANPCIS
jgi:DNA helicase-2/ATP-dependent DNA helicase PcrA